MEPSFVAVVMKKIKKIKKKGRERERRSETAVYFLFIKSFGPLACPFSYAATLLSSYEGVLINPRL